MKGLNKAYLIGHIGQDPELRTTAAGKSFLKLSLATPNAKKVGEEWVETPDWHRLTLFGQSADYVGRYARKGDVLAVECAIRPNKWTDKDNVVHHQIDLVVERVLWLNSKARGMGSAEAQGNRAVPPPPSAAKKAVDLEEIPF